MRNVPALREDRVAERLYIVDARKLAPVALCIMQGEPVKLLIRVTAIHLEAKLLEARRPVVALECGGTTFLDRKPQLASVLCNVMRFYRGDSLIRIRWACGIEGT